MLAFLNFRFRRRMRGASAARHRPRVRWCLCRLFALFFFVFIFPSTPLLKITPCLITRALFASDTRIGIAFLERRYVESNVFQETVSRSTAPSLKKLLFKQKYACVIVRVHVCVCVREREGVEII